MEISECVIQINSETNLIILVASGQGMFMKNAIILSIADRIKDALPIPTDEFRKRLEEDCYVIWKLPQFISGKSPSPPSFPPVLIILKQKMQRYMALMVLPAIKTNGEIIRKVLFVTVGAMMVTLSVKYFTGV